MIRLRKMLGDGGAVRLAVAFICGLLLGFLASKIGAGMQNVVPFLLFPLLVGIVGALSVGARNPRPYMMALGTGLLAWIGISVYLLIVDGQVAFNLCTAGACNTSSVLASLLTVYLLVGLVAVALAALITSVIARYARRERGLGQDLPR